MSSRRHLEWAFIRGGKIILSMLLRALLNVIAACMRLMCRIYFFDINKFFQLLVRLYAKIYDTLILLC